MFFAKIYMNVMA